MKKIIIPIDFSEASEKSIFYVLAWTEKWQVEIRLVHVVYYPVPEHAIPSYGMYTPVTSTQSALEELEREAKERMEELICRLQPKLKSRAHRTEVKGDTRIGEPVQEVIHLIDDYRPDLMVIGVKQRNLLGRLLWGSSTPAFISQVPIPILSIPESNSFTGIKHVAFASNFDDSDKAIFTQMYHFLSDDAPVFHCLHVVDQQDNIVINDQIDYMENMLRSHIDAKDEKSTVVYDVMASKKDLVQVIEEYVSDKQIDVIVLGTHKRKLLGKLLNPSQTKKLILTIDCPLLIFHV